MSQLKLQALTCPQCGAPDFVRQGTRITDCDRCGAKLCLTEVATPRYEAVANLSAAQALNTARGWLDRERRVGIFGRPELIFIPFHEIAGRRIGVFDRKVPERKRVHRRVHDSQAGGTVIESDWTYEEREDKKVMVSDVQHLTPAASAPWDLSMFDARSTRKMAQLRSFELVEIQRRATVYAAEGSATSFGERRFAGGKDTELVADSRRTIFFPFWSIPVRTDEGSYEIVLEAITGKIVAWRLPQPYPSGSWSWALLALPGSLLVGHGLYGVLFGTPTIPPTAALAIGALLSGVALARANRPDWMLRSWPEAGTIPRLEGDG